MRKRHTGGNNGGGMMYLSPERRKEIGECLATQNRERYSGWPECVQREGVEASYYRATEEWARRMEKLSWK